MTSALYGCGQHHQLSLSKRLSYDVEQPIERSGTCPACIFWIGSRPLKTRWIRKKEQLRLISQNFAQNLWNKGACSTLMQAKSMLFGTKGSSTEDPSLRLGRKQVPTPKRRLRKRNAEKRDRGKDLRTCTTVYGVIPSIYKPHPSWLSKQWTLLEIRGYLMTGEDMTPSGGRHLAIGLLSNSQTMASSGHTVVALVVVVVELVLGLPVALAPALGFCTARLRR
jgi:hypothetical protein